MKTITIIDSVGTFAENKDLAQQLRILDIMPTLQKQQTVILDFKGVTGTTQSFIHALISDAIRQFGSQALELISFKNCNPVVKKIILIVCDYMQQED